MTRIEIIPAHGREHKREIRRMAGSAVPVDPIRRALVEIASAAAAALLVGAFVGAFVGWWVG